MGGEDVDETRDDCTAQTGTAVNTFASDQSDIHVRFTSMRSIRRVHSRDVSGLCYDVPTVLTV
jgi:hypothetical protein